MKYFIILYSEAGESVGGWFLSQSSPIQSNLQNINSQSGGTPLHGCSVDGG